MSTVVNARRQTSAIGSIVPPASALLGGKSDSSKVVSDADHEKKIKVETKPGEEILPTDTEAIKVSYFAFVIQFVRLI